MKRFLQPFWLETFWLGTSPWVRPSILASMSEEYEIVSASSRTESWRPDSSVLFQIDFSGRFFCLDLRYLNVFAWIIWKEIKKTSSKPLVLDSKVEKLIAVVF